MCTDRILCSLKRMSEKCRNNNNSNSYNRLTFCRTDRGRNLFAVCNIVHGTPILFLYLLSLILTKIAIRVSAITKKHNNFLEFLNVGETIIFLSTGYFFRVTKR